METATPVIPAQVGIQRHPRQPALVTQRTRLNSGPRMLRGHWAVVLAPYPAA